MKILQPHRPERIWLIADGPKRGNQEEEGLCREARIEAERGITWECRIRKIYAKENLGLRRNVGEGLDAVFAEESEAIVLEDDCHPSPDFFPFCAEMLERYRSEPRVAGVSGNCFLPKTAHLDSDYFFSRYLHIWGWATWARAWKDYRQREWSWPQGGYREYFPEATRQEERYWNRIFARVRSGEIDTWDYPWVSHLWSRGWLSITPAQNLVQNLGFGPEATHTRDEKVKVGLERKGALCPPYRGPREIGANPALDRVIFTQHYVTMEGKLSFWPRLWRSLQKRLPRM